MSARFSAALLGDADNDGASTLPTFGMLRKRASG
jgi:hypothetical protein